jgi:alpha-galactosidase
VWSTHDNEALYLALFNTGETAPDVAVNLDQLNISGKIIGKELWTGKEIGPFQNMLTTNVPPHGAVLFRFNKQMLLYN